MKKNNSKYATSALTGFCLLLQGCSPNEKELWGLGSFVFLVFVAILVLNSIVPRIQEVPKFQVFVAKLEAFSEKVLPFILLVAIVVVKFFWPQFCIQPSSFSQQHLANDHHYVDAA